MAIKKKLVPAGTIMTMASIRKLNQEYGADTPLHEIPDHDVDNSDSMLALWFKSRGYDESPRRIINQHYGWNVTIGELERYY